MNPQDQLDYQAWVDGELPEVRARALEESLPSDPDARTFCDGLRNFRDVLRHHEPTVALPESRDFYWSKIRRAIEQGGASPAPFRSPERGSPYRWLGWLVPSAALALALVWALPKFSTRPAQPAPVAMAATMVGHEIEAPAAEGITTLTFYSAQDSMTVVWLGRVDIL
ncbi:MAG: hypothetical protein KF833_00875 [Verrucomicrobiae bacterium]|nr:hypothetical protein [Verrucomicrobiae bacterium]